MLEIFEMPHFPYLPNNFQIEKDQKLKAFVFLAFQIKMHLPSHVKNLIRMRFGSIPFITVLADLLQYTFEQLSYVRFHQHVVRQAHRYPHR